MEAYGYPYVLDEFHFHMTLTGNLPSGTHTDYFDWLTKTYRKIVVQPPELDQLAVCFQPDRQTAFTTLYEIDLKCWSSKQALDTTSAVSDKSHFLDVIGNYILMEW